MEWTWLSTPDSPARVLALGPARGPATAASGGRAPTWTAGDHIVLWRSLEREIQKRAGSRGCDVLHLTDVALAPFGRWFRSRSDIPVTVDVGPADLAAEGDEADRTFAAVDALDAAFVFGAAGEAALCRRTERVAVSSLPLIAAAASDPGVGPIEAVGQLLADLPPGRPVAVVAWSHDSAEFRWFAEEVLAAFSSDVLWLITGMPGGELPTGRTAHPASIRVHHGRFDDETIAALSRYADAFVAPWRLGGRAPEADALLRLALAASGTPVVAADSGSGVLEHERNAFIVRARDAAGFRATLEQLFTLPAKQRHYVGEEFAEDALARWPVGAATAVYEDRFAVLAGHPAIPAELRIA
jgi:hypothetical protein